MLIEERKVAKRGKSRGEWGKVAEARSRKKGKKKWLKK